MYENASLDWWETPLSGEGYEVFYITEGSWRDRRFVVRIDCKRPNEDAWESWLCSIDQTIWVRVVADEFYEASIVAARPEGVSKGPFLRISGSKQKSFYEDWLSTTGVLTDALSVHEFLISSEANEVHILAMQEPTFERVAELRIVGCQ